MELEAQLGRDVRVGRLLVLQHDVQADALAADIERAALPASMMPGPPR